MFEAYAISVSLKLQDLVSPELKKLALAFEKLDGLAISLRESLGKISFEAEGFKKLATAANSTNRAFEKASASAAVLHR